MDKKVLKSMYANIVATDQLRPIMNGIMFEEGRCYASDGRVLIIYRVGSKTQAGKVLGRDGLEIEGKYPNVDSVIPAEREEYKPRIDLKELYAACQYHQRKGGSEDRVSIFHKTFAVKTILRVLNVFQSAGLLGKAVMYESGPSQGTVIECEQMTGLMMPFLHDEELVDTAGDDDTIKTLSYEALMNDYAFNSWQKPETKDWMDGI